MKSLVALLLISGWVNGNLERVEIANNSSSTVCETRFYDVTTKSLVLIMYTPPHSQSAWPAFDSGIEFRTPILGKSFYFTSDCDVKVNAPWPKQGTFADLNKPLR